MLIQLALGSIIILLTFFAQAYAFDWILHATLKIEKRFYKHGRKAFLRLITLYMIITGVTLTLIAQIWLWGFIYLGVGAFNDLETAIYFSASSYTTVGFGDVYLGKDWRLLSSIEAMNGFMMFGWATAFMFGVINNLYRKENKALDL